MIALMQPAGTRLESRAFKENKAEVILEFDFVAISVRPFKWDETPTQALTRMREEWGETLDTFPIAEVRRGIAGVLEGFAKDGIRGRMPCRFQVREQINAYRAAAIRRAAPDPQPDPERVEATPESRARVAEMVAELGGSKRVGGAK